MRDLQFKYCSLYNPVLLFCIFTDPDITAAILALAIPPRYCADPTQTPEDDRFDFDPDFIPPVRVIFFR